MIMLNGLEELVFNLSNPVDQIMLKDIIGEIRYNLIVDVDGELELEDPFEFKRKCRLDLEPVYDEDLKCGDYVRRVYELEHELYSYIDSGDKSKLLDYTGEYVDLHFVDYIEYLDSKLHSIRWSCEDMGEEVEFKTELDCNYTFRYSISKLSFEDELDKLLNDFDYEGFIDQVSYDLTLTSEYTVDELLDMLDERLDLLRGLE